VSVSRTIGVGFFDGGEHGDALAVRERGKLLGRNRVAKQREAGQERNLGNGFMSSCVEIVELNTVVQAKSLGAAVTFHQRSGVPPESALHARQPPR